MEFRLCIILIFSIFIMMIDPSSSSSLSSIMHGEDHRSISTRKCNGGLVGNCIDEEEEMMMESDISRRVLGGRNGYVSYGAMSRNNVPCNVRGASYYNCHANQRVNPYRRGCTQITRCARTNS
ncbi:hypothetical protein R3W88_032301 [Solanum pinnatisectum]|uniref:Rapid ALkalinization Factor n=1 Tax=Solanum pinnatisectum TaxID=50273 RepID=A0AAV9LS82_9SOLN|nr:hypothetical protein R3W88_032301 [Solanum pinnatisectum]